MLKTNSKKARENIRAWILDHSKTYDDEPFETFAEAAAYVWRTFKAEKMGDEQRRRYELHHNKTWGGCFADWLAGLPHVLDGAAYYYKGDARDVLGEILEETEEERERYTTQEAERLMSHLLFREITKQVDF